MIDKQQALNNQLSEFLLEFKFRFSVLNHSGMPGKFGYTTKLNRNENCSLNIYLTDNFPFNAPIIYVIPPKIEIQGYIDDMGRVKDSCLSYWNVNSTLVSAVRTILTRLEVDGGIKINDINNKENSLGGKMSSFYSNYGSSLYTNSINPISNTAKVSNNNISPGSTSSKIQPNQESNILANDLNCKSIEELIYIYLNQEEYVNEFMSKYKEPLNKIKKEVEILYDECDKKRSNYNKEMEKVTSAMNEFNQYKDELKNVYFDKIKYDNKFTLDNLFDKLNEDLNKTNNERQRLIAEFLAKKIDFDQFQKGFKDQSMKLHFVTITKEKLYQLKNRDLI